MLKLGKLPADPRPSDFKLSTYEIALPSVPTKPFGYGNLYSDWGGLGNFRYGDCVLAGADHETMLYNKLAGHPVKFTDDNTLSDYSAATGFDPNVPSSDRGANCHNIMSYRRSTGMIDAVGKRHKIDAYMSIDPGDWNKMLQCVWTFGAVGIGFEVPQSAMDQFNRGEKWEDVGDTNIIGGHYVPGVGSMAPSVEASFITWGRRQRMTKKFYQRYNDEAWVPLSFESLKLSGFNVRHLDRAALQADLNAL